MRVATMEFWRVHRPAARRECASCALATVGLDGCRSTLSIEVDRAQAQTAQAGPLAQAQAQREVLEMRTELAQRAAELRQQELLAEVVKPAEAEAERVRILAVADAEKMRIQAEAAASPNRVALDRMLIDQLPEIVGQAAKGLAGANLTILNGASGLSEVATGLVGQGLAIFDSLRGGLDRNRADDNTNQQPAELAGPATD